MLISNVRPSLIVLINFTLTPIENIQPWGSPGNLRISWFGLTDGQYWLELGKNTLFEYSESAQATGASRYCDYQVVRLYEDLLEMLPHILEPIPSPLIQYISGDTGIAWREKWSSWCDNNADSPDENQYWKIVDASSGWFGARILDSAYLCPSASILIWSDAENIHFEWDNREKVIDGKPAWSALRGHHQLTRADFMAEIRSFHERLMEQMSERIEQVLSGALSPEINIDLSGLVREHAERCRSLDYALNHPSATDWQETERAINEILGI